MWSSFAKLRWLILTKPIDGAISPVLCARASCFVDSHLSAGTDAMMTIDSTSFKEVTKPAVPIPFESFRFCNHSEMLGLANFNNQLKVTDFNFTSNHKTITISRIFPQRKLAPMPAYVNWARHSIDMDTPTLEDAFDRLKSFCDRHSVSGEPPLNDVNGVNEAPLKDVDGVN
ncbi:hypothetical protein F2Q70_00022175 [Brassica cretica]|nr:hypothetical protein F2Q70_00022175 [Brassica cretica]